MATLLTPESSKSWEVGRIKVRPREADQSAADAVSTNAKYTSGITVPHCSKAFASTILHSQIVVRYIQTPADQCVCRFGILRMGHAPGRYTAKIYSASKGIAAGLQIRR